MNYKKKNDNIFHTIFLLIIFILEPIKYALFTILCIVLFYNKSSYNGVIYTK